MFESNYETLNATDYNDLQFYWTEITFKTVTYYDTLFIIS